MAHQVQAGSSFILFIKTGQEMEEEWMGSGRGQMKGSGRGQDERRKEKLLSLSCAKMKLNISFPATGCQKLIEVNDERKLRTFYEKRMATEVAADALGEEWKGYVVRISGGNDK
ncbi:hypothetical protein U0070_012859 [Myodes glareolus]|uniref:Small ribosomal subunit protein eS6 n=1 Tax=Myodes glareolus TaxID=447135 RepID=A0AAW0ICL4_MYOGA